MRSRLKLPATRADKVPATSGQVLLLKPLAQVIALLVFAGGAHACLLYTSPSPRD